MTSSYVRTSSYEQYEWYDLQQTTVTISHVDQKQHVTLNRLTKVTAAIIPVFTGPRAANQCVATVANNRGEP